MQMNMEIKYYISPTKGKNWLFDIPQPGGGGEKFPYLQLAMLPQHINFTNHAFLQEVETKTENHHYMLWVHINW
jgi:hypothetical protein